MNSASLELAITFDKRYVDGAIASLRSVASTSPAKSRVWIITDPLSDCAVSRIRAAAWPLKLEFVRPFIPELPLYGASSSIVYARLFLAELLPNLNRVVYLDTDTIVLHSLEPLFQISSCGAPLCAVQDYFWRNGPDDKFNGYFNSGVFVADLNVWRSLEVSRRASTYVRAYHCQYWDQDALNAVLEGRWLELDPLWNVYHFDEIGVPEYSLLSREHVLRFWRHLQDQARVLHYVTDLKPWMQNYPKGRNLNRYRRWSDVVYSCD